MNIDAYTFTHAGGRSYNEDFVGAKSYPTGELFVVADGLGGHLHGEMASSCAVNAILGSFDWEAEPQEALEQALSNANTEILALQKESHGKMRTTAVCLLLQKNRAYWAHVGDSRLYYLHNGEVAAYTADHSVAYKKYKSGEITRSQIATDEDQPSLLRALGNPTRNKCQCDAAKTPLAPGDGFLLCSDGLWEYLRDQEILVDMLKTETAKEWARLLLLRVMERIAPGNDNLSLIAVRIS